MQFIKKPNLDYMKLRKIAFGFFGAFAYSGKEKQMVMTITNNLQLKRLEEKVFSVDQNALFIVENSFSVIGSGFGKRKIY